MKALAARTPAALQRTCTCGRSAPAGGECEECKRVRQQSAATMQRASVAAAPGDGAPPPRASGKDFGNVRVGGRPRLAIGRVDDPLEREADRVAAELFASPAPAWPLSARRAAAPSPLHAPPAVEGYVDRLDRSGGERLPAPTRASLEPRLGHGLSSVRIHRDGAAAEASRSVSARAFTVGRHVVFGAGQYAPETVAGQRLLAHELTHVVQQSGSGTAMLQRAPWGVCPPGTRLSGNRPDRYVAAEAAAWFYFLAKRRGHCIAQNIDDLAGLKCAQPEGRLLAEQFHSGRGRVPQRPVMPADDVAAPGVDYGSLVGKVGDFAYRQLVPDLIDFTDHEFYDVTTKKESAAKKHKVAWYARLASAITGRKWKAGRTLGAPGIPTFPLWPGRPTRICFGGTDLDAQPGVLAYEVIGTEEQKKKDKKEDEERKKEREEKQRKKEEKQRKKEEAKREKERKREERERAKKEREQAKKEKEGKPKEREKEPGAPGGGANLGFGISIGGGGGAGNVGVGVSIMSNGHAYGTVGAGVVFNSDGVAVGSVGAGVSSGSTTLGAGTAGAGLQEDTTSAGAGTAGLGKSEGSTSAGAGTAGMGTSKDDLTAGAGVAGKGKSEGQVGATAGRTSSGTTDEQPGGDAGGTKHEGSTEPGGKSEKEGTGTAPGGKQGDPGGPGATGSGSTRTPGATTSTGGTGEGAAGTPGKHGLSIPGQSPGAVDKAVEDAARIEEMVRKARPQQRALLERLARVTGDKQYVVPASTWVTTILQATDGVKDEDIDYLATLQWQPGKVTADELKRNIAAALKRRRSGAQSSADAADPAAKGPAGPAQKPKPGANKGASVKPGTKAKPKPKPKKAAVGGAGPAEKGAKPDSPEDFVKHLVERIASYPDWDSIAVGEVIYDAKKPFPQTMAVYYKLHDHGKVVRVTFDVWGRIEPRGKGRVLKVIGSSSVVTEDGRSTPPHTFDGQELPLQ